MKIILLSLLLLNFSQYKIVNNTHDRIAPEAAENELNVTQVVKGAELQNPALRNHGLEMKNYFENLRKYSPANIRTSCGYVSFIQLLSYIDTFINDDFIPEKYEKFNLESETFEEVVVESPGVLKNANYSKMDIYSFTNKYFETDYQAYLIKLMNEDTRKSPNDWSDRISVDEYLDLLNKLIPNLEIEFVKFRVSDNELYLYSSKVMQDALKNIIKNQLSLGNPVILHLAKELENNKRKEYHSVVAYDYDDENIYAHFGRSEGTERRPITYKGYYITDYGYFMLSDIPHKCSNNYVVKGHGFCGCNSHEYLFDPVWVDYKYHFIKCHCGSVIKMPHVVTTSSLKALPAKKICSICGGEVERGLIIGPQESYVDKTGIIVLDEEDLELYKRGLLNIKELPVYEK